MNIVIAPSSYPFRFEGREYRVLKSGFEDDVAYAEVSPPNERLRDELIRRIQREKSLTVYLGFGYVCFPEQYPVGLD